VKSSKWWHDDITTKMQDSIIWAELEYFSERLIIDNDGKILFANEKYAKEHGYESADLVGMNYKDMFQIGEEPIVLNIANFGRQYNPDRDRIFEWKAERPILCSAPVLDENGKEIGFILHDGIYWLNRYKCLFDKLEKLKEEMFLVLQGPHEVYNLIGISPAMQKIREQIAQVANIKTTVLIEGETGCGKEVIANAIFVSGNRSDRNLVKLNCAAIPQELIESELFGYVEGAFTGAKKGGKKGKFELANGGVIVLDEINSLPLSAQTKLLRVLQEREIDRIGGEKPIPIDVRVIAISNKPLAELVEQGKFREDLYYRLNVFRIVVPPLRERKEDIPLLVNHFIQKCNEEMGKNIEHIDKNVYRYLKSFDWPGNVRELRNYVERAMITAWRCDLTLDNFSWMDDNLATVFAREELLDPENSDQMSLAERMKNVERKIIISELEKHGYKKAVTAKSLGISRQVLYNKMKQFGIDS